MGFIFQQTLFWGEWTTERGKEKKWKHWKKTCPCAHLQMRVGDRFRDGDIRVSRGWKVKRHEDTRAGDRGNRWTGKRRETRERKEETQKLARWPSCRKDEKWEGKKLDWGAFWQMFQLWPWREVLYQAGQLKGMRKPFLPAHTHTSFSVPDCVFFKWRRIIVRPCGSAGAAGYVMVMKPGQVGVRFSRTMGATSKRLWQV